MDKENILQMFFPHKVFAVAFPLAIGVIGLLIIGNGTIFPPIFSDVFSSRQQRTELIFQ